MANIHKLEMGMALSKDSRIAFQKGFLGLGTKAFYQPTGSPIEIFRYEYNNEKGKLLETLFQNTVSESLEERVRKIGTAKSDAIGNTRLEACLSLDHQFAALQLFHYSDFKLVPATDLNIFEGKEAEILARLFQ